ncbi:CocE/NonD family hydrolase [Glaciecola sp. 2405UD65-10]|uniref:CocE/NonD family hydrolase n=1 Tax=Glaciecola sp. 2405UD65-10 TaxID=3397244 RepID=UPI003B58DADC
MKRSRIFLLWTISVFFASFAHATDYSNYSEAALKKLLNEIAVVETKILMPMRDGVGLSTDIYRPKNAKGPVPAIFVKTPYNMNSLNARSLRSAVEAVSRGYAYVMQNERGRYFSEGKFEILGYPRTDGVDAIDWLANQEWSNEKIGTIGCSSSAEWQHGLAAMDHPAHVAMIPQASGAGIGRVGDFHEQGNWYTGGVQRMLFFIWLYGVDNPLRAQIPEGLSPEIRTHIAQYNDLKTNKPSVDWTKQIQHLPIQELLSSLGEPKGTFEELVKRTPASKAWFEGGLYHDNEPWGVPSLWFNSWYDVSIGPNMALFNHATKNGNTAQVRENQYVVVAPNNHCRFAGLGPDFVSGDRNLGDTSFDDTALIWSWWDKWLMGNSKAFDENTPKVQYYTMGANKWQADTQWPPKAAKDVKIYLNSGGQANSLYGDGKLSFDKPNSGSDTFYYDPMNPVPTIGGGDCCNGGLVEAGAFDQRSIAVRNDVLVFTSEPLNEALEVTGFVDAVLHVSSSAKDTDFAVKLVDVAPDGTAYIIDDTIMRARYREGYNTQVMMTPGEVYKLDMTPMTTSIEFQKGHRIRVEVTSSNFPKFARNLNTGGNNYDESEGVVATNSVHHSSEYPSYLVLPVVNN